MYRNYLSLAVVGIGALLIASHLDASSTVGPSPTSADASSIPSWWTDCMNKGSEVMSEKSAAQSVLNCCATVWGCDCVAQACPTHTAYHGCANPKLTCRPNCQPTDGNLTLPACKDLPGLAIIHRPWFWLALAGVIIAIILTLIIILVIRKKFASASGKKGRKSSLHFGLDGQPNISSSVMTKKKTSKHSHHKKERKTGGASVRKSQGGAKKAP